MSIQLATRANRTAQRLQTPAPELPPAPARRRAAAPARPAAPAVSNETATLTALLQDYAVANAAKNAGTREEKKAKDTLNETMVEMGKTEFSASVSVNGDLIAYDAKLGETEEEFFDMRVIRSLCPDEDTFFSIITVTKKAVEDALGKNALLKARRTRMKPASLSVTKAK